MNLFVNAAVAAVRDAVYNLATRLFKTETPLCLALAPVGKSRAADIITLLNLGLLSFLVIYLKLKGKFPRFLSSQVLILVLLSAASLGCFIHPHVSNYAGARAHASLTLLRNAPHFGLVYFFESIQFKSEFWKYPLILHVLLCHSGAAVFESLSFFILGYLPAFFKPYEKPPGASFSPSHPAPSLHPTRPLPPLLQQPSV